MYDADPSVRKRAVLIGVAYQPRRRGNSGPALRCTHEDIRAFEKMLKERSFESVVMLDQRGHPEMLQPRRPNILRELALLVQSARAGDRLVVCFSGHGKQLPTRDADEDDGQDEHIIPQDWEQGGIISDNMLNRLLVAKLPEGVRLLVIVDACHSGTILDLRYNWFVRGNMPGVLSPKHYPPLSFSEVLMEHIGFWRERRSQVLCMSASRDANRAFEKKKCSYIRFLLTAYGQDKEITIRSLVHRIIDNLRAHLGGDVTEAEMQRPQISSNDPYFDLDARLAEFL
ncbi:hypothetical protein AURDEDRAFT_111828 [Auricularia subglabra TFB-10046 SS5]|nr:hypothetical protein AURDEDRAFT_111828 [Auricularia subglabra TFB-10046 SS5]